MPWGQQNNPLQWWTIWCGLPQSPVSRANNSLATIQFPAEFGLISSFSSPKTSSMIAWLRFWTSGSGLGKRWRTIQRPQTEYEIWWKWFLSMRSEVFSLQFCISYMYNHQKLCKSCMDGRSITLSILCKHSKRPMAWNPKLYDVQDKRYHSVWNLYIAMP